MSDPRTALGKWLDEMESALRGDSSAPAMEYRHQIGLLFERLAQERDRQYDQAVESTQRALVAEARLDEVREGLEKLMQFRWNDRGYGQLTCRSCGALASMDYDDDGGHFRRIDKCSKSCPWQVAETLIAGLEEPGI